MTPAFASTVAALISVWPKVAADGVDGPALTREHLAGRPAIVQFWASWCTSCESVTREVEAALDAAPVSVRYVAVSLDETKDAARAAVVAGRFRGLPHVPEVAFDADRKLAGALGETAVPTVLVVGADGTILARLKGHFEAAQRAELKARLRTLAAATPPDQTSK